MKSYRIYINDNTLLVADELPKHIEKIQRLDIENFDFLSFYKSIKKEEGKHYALVTKQPQDLFKNIRKKLTLVKAGGGLVKNANGEFLFIFRNKKWDLPKGKLEKGEKIKETAVREVEEECGVEIAKREEKLCKTYHIYELNNKVIVKKTTWFRMSVKGSPKLVPQEEEGITTASWVATSDIKVKMRNTYPLILDVLKAENLI